MNLFLLAVGPQLQTSDMSPQRRLAASTLDWRVPGSLRSRHSISAIHTRNPTFVPRVGFRREQLTTPWEVASLWREGDLCCGRP